MRLSAPIHRLKRYAKQLSRDKNIPLHEALDQIAIREGFQRWSHLAAGQDRPAPITILDELKGGDRMLLAARRGHGKTLIGLEIAALAQQRGMTGMFFTLDFTEREAAERLQAISGSGDVAIDASDEICADYIVERLRSVRGPTIAVIDYLQALDQRRTTPDLDAQVATLQAHARQSGDIIVAISQIDRAFEASGRSVPDLPDIRLPNPVDLSRFNRTCFLHDGAMLFENAA